MSTQTQRLLDSRAVQAIMGKRQPVGTAQVDRKVVLTIQGNGNVIPVLDKDGKTVFSTIAGSEGVSLDKKIFNLRAASQLAMSLPINRDLMVAGLAAEKKGDKDAAHENFNAYLNATQVSFGIILPSAIADQLGNGVDIAAKVQLVTTDKGSLLTIDTSTISIKEPDFLPSATVFNIADFVAKEEAPANEIAAQRKKRLAGQTV